MDEELAEAVGRHEREERGAETDDEMRPEPGLAFAQLALEADRAAERRGDDEPQQDVRPRERRDRRRAQGSATDTASSWTSPISAIPDSASASSSSSVSRVNGSRSAVACTSTSRPSPVMTTFMSVSAFESSE